MNAESNTSRMFGKSPSPPFSYWGIPSEHDGGLEMETDS
jgi:hypothetical protein